MNHPPSQPRLRLLHHWACSGGTLISRCVASLPDVILLSEVHPFGYLRQLEASAQAYLPTDLVQQLSLPHNGRDPALVLAAFCGAVEGLLLKADSLGRPVVVRCHDHIDFFTGALPGSRYTLASAMAERASLRRQLTVRHPLDCWLSLRLTDWVQQIAFASFDEFCGRCLAMLDADPELPWTTYENFVLDPARVLGQIAATLELRFDSSALEHFASLTLSGDSGRSGGTIEPRPRRAVDQELIREMASSSHYGNLCERLAYLDDPEAPFPYRAKESPTPLPYGSGSAETAIA